MNKILVQSRDKSDPCHAPWKHHSLEDDMFEAMREVVCMTAQSDSKVIEYRIDPKHFSGKDDKELEMRRRFMDNLPFCPDHRDKVVGKFCRECEIERLKGVIRRVIQGKWCVTDLQEAIGDLK